MFSSISFRATKKQKLLNNHTDKNPVMLLNELKPGKAKLIYNCKPIDLRCLQRLQRNLIPIRDFDIT
jgi:hypothetical protein